MRKFNEFGNGEKVILISVVISILSLFMSWVDVGFMSRNGFQQYGFIFMILFIYPTYKVIKDEKMSFKIAIPSALIAIILGIAQFVSNSVDVFGEVINVSSTGLYIYIIASIGFTIGIFMLKKEIGKVNLGEKSFENLDENINGFKDLKEDEEIIEDIKKPFNLKK